MLEIFDMTKKDKAFWPTTDALDGDA